MAQTFAQFDTPIASDEGDAFTAKVCGRQREDGLWEGWIEFEDTLTGDVLRSTRETTQPNASDLTYWATGLTSVYLEGALARVLKDPKARGEALEPPVFDAPADKSDARRHSTGLAILDPFSVYEKGPDLLAQELMALRPRHLRQIIKEYQLTSEPEESLDSLTKQELGSLIVSRVRELHA